MRPSRYGRTRKRIPVRVCRDVARSRESSEAFLLVQSRIRALLDFEQNRVFQCAKSVASRYEQQHITRTKLSRGREFLIVSEDVNFASAFLDDQDFGSACEVAVYRLMHMAGYG